MKCTAPKWGWKANERTGKADALDRRIKLAVPVAGALRRGDVDSLRHRREPQGFRGRLPGVRAAARAGPNHRAWQLLAAGRGADHDPTGGAAQRHPGTRGHALHIRFRPLVYRAHLRAGDRHLPRAAGGAGASDGGDSYVADLGGTDSNNASALVDESDHGDRTLLRHVEPDRD